MVSTLLLAVALTVTGQSDYNLLAQENVPAAQATVQTPNGAYADEKVGALADARAKVRAYSRGLAEAQAQVRELTQSIATEKPPTSRIEYADENDSSVIRSTAPIRRSAPVIRSTPVIRTVPRVRSAMYSTSPSATYAGASPVTGGESCYSSSYSSSAAPSTYAEAAPVMGTSCYSSSVAPNTYSTPMVAAPTTYSAAAPVTFMTAAPFTYSTAAPVTFAAAAPAFSSGVSTYRERTRLGLFGRLRQNIRATTFGGAPAAFGSGFFGAGAVCASGTCP